MGNHGTARNTQNSTEKNTEYRFAYGKDGKTKEVGSFKRISGIPVGKKGSIRKGHSSRKLRNTPEASHFLRLSVFSGSEAVFRVFFRGILCVPCCSVVTHIHSKNPISGNHLRDTHIHSKNPISGNHLRDTHIHSKNPITGNHLRKPSPETIFEIPTYIQRPARKPILIAPQILFSIQKLGGFISISNFEKEGDKAKCQLRDSPA